ncbi:MAG: bifunctional 3-(3-hydroxy-phenyl)propionate/3-hydroxycinnamic acid hydroxylase [Thermoleophilaceae bacterium]|nr:bifunctional 3-(3-hydroxy-phenyl)propionate/3-hydroxycinnamic acid hydroxylase [Thermoleophilaceae bacterium]
MMIDCEVLICGLGPVGQLLALLLTDLGVSVIAVDEADEPYPLPRAAVIDDEVLRIFQAIGLDAAVLRDAQVQKTVTFVTDRGKKYEVLRPAHGDLGHPPLVSIHQPSMEHTMTAALDERGQTDVRWGTRVETVDRAADHVDVYVRPTAGGRSSRIRSRFVVACDGGKSFVRRTLQIPFGGSTYSQRWLVLDGLIDKPLAKVPHPHFVGDVKRPTVSLPMSPGRHRWEFMLHPGEDAAPFEREARIRELTAPYITDEQVEFERAVVYTFHVRRAERWRAGRVFLAGDSAHLTPPFVGQGFSSGARDAQNLAWKLEAVLRGAPSRLLDSYEVERRPHVTSMQNLAVRWGGVVQTANPAVGRMRDGLIGLAKLTGVLSIIREQVKPLPTYGHGAFAERPAKLPFNRSVGSLFPQPERIDVQLGNRWSVVADSPAIAKAWRARGVASICSPVDPWLRANHCEWALLRPDKFVYATGDAGDIAAAAKGLEGLLGASLGSLVPNAPAPSSPAPESAAAVAS